MISMEALSTLENDVNLWLGDEANFSVAITNHFRERSNDERNSPAVGITELNIVLACAAEKADKLNEVLIGDSVVLADPGGNLYVCCEMVEDTRDRSRRLLLSTVIRTNTFFNPRKAKVIEI